MIDKIDRVLAKHYGFPAAGGSACGGTDPPSSRPLEYWGYAAASEKLDFIINYDPAMRGAGIKYRMKLGGEQKWEGKMACKNSSKICLRSVDNVLLYL